MGRVIVEQAKRSSHNMTYNIKEEGVDNFVDDKSLVNPIIKDFEARGLNVPKIFGVPRSGSTLMRNILNTIFDGKVRVQNHKYWDPEDNDMIIATYRDFRDCTASKWRMNSGGFDNEKDAFKVKWDHNMDKTADNVNTMRNAASALKIRVEGLNRFDELYYNKKLGYKQKMVKINRNIYFARYEEFQNNYEFLFNHLEQFLKVTIKRDLRDFIQERWNKGRVKRVYSDTIKAFSGYDVKTEIHGQHIYKGKVGTWKEFLEESQHGEMTSFWRNQLIRWGYEL